ncbi:hypothetical protein D3C85_368020 [compost metagenome]
MATADIDAGACQVSGACPEQLAVCGQPLHGAYRQVASRAQAAIGLDTGADQTACAAVKAVRRDAVIALRCNHASIRNSTFRGKRLAPGRIQTAGVVQGVERSVQICAGKHTTRRIVQVRHIQGGVARHGLQLALGIVDVATGQCQVAPCRHRPFRIVQAAHVQYRIVRSHDAARVVQQGVSFYQRIAIAFDLAARVVQLASDRHRHQSATCLCQAAAAVVQTASIDGQLIGHRGRIAVIESGRSDVELAIARDLAELVVELARIDGQQAAARVLQLAIDVR